MSAPFPILFEDNHLLAVDKPAGIATMGVSPDRQSVLSMAQDYVKHKYHKPGNVYLGIVSRLDAPVSGVLLLARTSKAAARLNDQFRNREVEKVYWALVEGRIEPPAATLDDQLVHDDRHRRMHVAATDRTADRPDAKHARLHYRLLATFDGPAPVRRVSLVEVTLDTGRKHQIRLQLAHRGHPILGDRKYGSRLAFPVGIALHARRLALQHPVQHVPLELVAPVPACWPTVVVSIGRQG
jgi:23S rRNA pseudouridine1911/1915/1917 synthase